MEFVKANFINTTTQITFDSNTLTIENIFNRDPTFQYFSDGYNDDLTTTTVTIAFDETMTVDRIALMEHNLKDFTLFYNGATANTFAMSTTSDTISTSYASNSETAQYFQVTSVNCTSVTLDMKSTQVANAEKAVGFFMVSQSELDFPRIPSAGDYKPVLDPRKVRHKLSDGGNRVHREKDKWRADVKFANIEASFRDNLKAVYDQNKPFNFVPFGTTTSWDEILFESVWINNFDFYKHSDNAVNAGFTGNIKLVETS
jgi:hypothetical protein